MASRREIYRAVQSAIDHVGWHVMAIGPGDGFPAFCYSQGFKRLNHPDFIITGVGQRVGYEFIHQLYEQVRNGVRYEPNVEYTDIAANGYKAQFVKVHPSWRDALCTVTAAVYHNKPFELLQFIIPDKYHRWPWQEGYLSYASCPLLDREKHTAISA